MAKKAKPQASPAGEGGDEAPAKGGKKKLILIVAGVVLLAGAGGGFFLFKPSGGHGASADAAHGKAVAFVDVAEMVVNLASEPNQEKPRFLKLKVALEVKDDKAVTDVQPLLPRVQDIFQVFVRELRPSDLEGSGGVHRLREELLRRVNMAVFPTRVDAVLFREVIVQ